MVDLLPLALEPNSSVRHHALPLRGSNLTTQVGLPTLTEFTFLTLGSVEWDDMIADLNVGDSFTDGFDNTPSFVTEDGGENSLTILS